MTRKPVLLNLSGLDHILNYLASKLPPASLLSIWLLLLPAGCFREEQMGPDDGKTVLRIGLPESKTCLGESVDGKRSVYWTDGDRLCVNGVASEALSGVAEGASSAEFTFNGILNAPYNILYPTGAYIDASHINFPASQTFVAGGPDPAAMLMAGYSEAAGNSLQISHLCALVHIVVKSKDSSNLTLSTVRFRGNGDEQVSGLYTIDYCTPSLEATSSEEADKVITMTVGEDLSLSTALELFISVPAGTYEDGFTVALTDSRGHCMNVARESSIDLLPGTLVKMPELVFDPSSSGFNVTGRVVDNGGIPIEGVVVSDGIQCVATDSDGAYFLNADTSTAKFIQISTPSGYLPPVSSGSPRFYKLLSEQSQSGGIYTVEDFVLTPVANPGTYTLFISADPQPRAASAGMDKVAYHSTDICDGLYLDLRESASAISGRQVYGICLGDLVHENMSLMDTYAAALGTLGFPTYNVIGNHDNDPSATDDDGGAWKFESLFGPRNYSFNIGGIHFVVLDDLIMKQNPDNDNKLTAYDRGLTDEIWAWLQNDMDFVPKSTVVMTFAHSPMFKCDSGSERTNTSKHGGHNASEDYAYGYGTLLDRYDEVHAWAGHTHSTFNYIYPSSHRNRNVQVHTVARSTGELWTNEYISNGTPRGFTIVEVVDGAVASWRFHPTKYLMSIFVGRYGQPSYDYCDWDYVNAGSQKVAKMKDTGEDLDESYQMHIFPPDVYGDGKLYVNVFLWDSMWQLPTLTMEGGSPVTMTHIEDVNVTEEERTGFDMADKEIKDFYYANYSTLRSAGYKAHSPGLPLTMFSVDAPASGTGTVSVTDRFGTTWSRTVLWGASD